MLVIGSRGSQLALWQANYIQQRLNSRGFETRIEVIKTTGDRITDVPLAQIGGKGLFTKEIEDALLEGRIDLAVHSLKDLPTTLPKGLTLAATPPRQDPLDAMVGGRLAELPPGAKVGTSSLRRAAQIRMHRPDLMIESIRGNLDTRLRKLDEGQYDAIVLAAAGLKRMGWGDRISQKLPANIMCPAVGQGALAIETTESGAGLDACAPLDDPWTRFAVTAERALLGALGGGCQVPIGAYATVHDSKLILTGVVIAPDGTRLIRQTVEGDLGKPVQLGRDLGESLLQRGAREILDTVYSEPRDVAV